MRTACIVIASIGRQALLRDLVVPSVLAHDFDEVCVVGDYEPGEGYRYLHVPPMTRSTTDALVKRDVGVVATTADAICFLSDDHRLRASFGNTLRILCSPAHVNRWDVLVPERYTTHPVEGLVRINNGEREGYCGGHGGVYKRTVLQDRPWSAMPHDRVWDLKASHAQQQAGFRFVAETGLAIEDIEPGAEPWR